MSFPSLPRIQGSILHGRQRLRDHLVAAMRREPITWVGDETEADEDGPQGDTPRWPKWGLLALVFIATLFIAAVPVAAESPTGPITIAPPPPPPPPQPPPPPPQPPPPPPQPPPPPPQPPPPQPPPPPPQPPPPPPPPAIAAAAIAIAIAAAAIAIAVAVAAVAAAAATVLRGLP